MELGVEGEAPGVEPEVEHEVEEVLEVEAGAGEGQILSPLLRSDVELASALRSALHWSRSFALAPAAV